MKLRFAIISMIMLVAIGSRAATAQQIVDILDAGNLPVYVRVIDNREDLEQLHLSDSLFNAIAGSTIFKVNRTEINRNDPFLHEMTDVVLPLTRSRNLRLVGIDLRGAASPEGPYKNNVRLSKGRAKALIDYIGSGLDDDALSAIKVETVAEDYPYLLWILRGMGDSAADVLQRIIDDCGLDNPAEIKRRLKAYNKGRTWARLLRDIFPRLRAARIVLYFCPVETREIVNVVPADLVLPDFDMPLPQVNLSINPIPMALPELPLKRQHMLSLSTNLLYDAFYMPNYGWAPMPNIGVEYYPRGGHWTFRGAFMFPYYHKWDKNKFFQIRDYHLEVRRYARPGDWHTGLYIGAYVNATKYGIGLSKTKGWQGEGMGGALKLGYVLPIGHGPLRLDLHIAAGAWYTRFDPYVYGNPITGDVDGDYYYDYTGDKNDFHRRNHKLMWAGPTEIGATLTFDILYRKRR